MALKNSLEPTTVAERLAVALRRHLGPHLEGAADARVEAVEIPSANGMSNETVLFDATWDGPGGPRRERLAARVQPSGPAVFPRYDLGLEYAVMSTLAEHTDVPVPRMFFHEPDAGLLGAPFLVMARVDGRVPSDDPPYTAGGWVTELGAEQQATLHDNALRTLAGIHAVDLDRVGLRHLRAHPEAGVAGQLTLWRDTFAWAAEGDRNPTVEAALDWLADNQPADTGPDVLNWGDARIGNLLFDGSHSVTAVLDWEMLCVGPRELDLGWWLFMQRYYSEGLDLPAPPGFPDHERLAARYRELTGHDPAGLHFYEVLAGTRLAVLMHRAGKLMIAAGQLPPDSTMTLSNPASQLLARLLDLPAPAGLTQSFVGHR
jgi:aminoglycoside phosphotransferase (APT) family kinase protein